MYEKMFMKAEPVELQLARKERKEEFSPSTTSMGFH
jgi:hypothetical protein